MKQPTRMVCLGLAVLACGTASAQAGQDVALALDTLVTQARAGGPVHLRVTLANNSKHPISVKLSAGHNGEEDYYLEVGDASGHRAPLTRFGARLYRDGEMFAPGVRRVVSIGPGVTASEQLAADRVYELAHAGTYTFQAFCTVATASGQEDIQSNIVTITLRN